MPVSHSEVNGLLVVDKPGGHLMHYTQDVADVATWLPAGVATPADAYLPTSHDVVKRVRRWSGQRRLGHTGTLDPLASGILVLCLGSATRLVEYYQGEDKQYLAEIHLGRATDSYDVLGHETATGAVPSLTGDLVDAALGTFRGEIWQQPPVFAAIKQGGERLYNLARRGEQVVAAPRRVTFFELTLLEFLAPDRVRLRVRCSAGAYIRSLAHDLGIALGTHALLAGLRREAAGAFTLHDAHPLHAVQAAAEAEQLEALLLPPGERLPFPVAAFAPDELTRLGHGQVVPVAQADRSGEGDLVQARDGAGRLVGIARRLAPAQPDPALPPAWLWKAEKWMA